MISALALLLLAGAADVDALLRALSSPSGAERREAERALVRELREEDLPRVERAIEEGDAETRRRLARVLGSRADQLGWLFGICARGEGSRREVAVEAIRVFLAAGTRPLGERPLPQPSSIPLPFRPILADYRGETLARFLEDLHRFLALEEPLLLDPSALAGLGAGFPSGELRGSLPDVVAAAAAAADLKRVDFPSFAVLTRDPSLADGADFFVRLARAYGRGEGPERRAAAVALALLGLPAVDAILARDALGEGEKARDALAGLCAPCGRGVPEPLRTAPLLGRLLDSLSGADADLRRGAAHALRALAPGEPKAVAAMVAKIEASSGHLRAILLRIVGTAGVPEVLRAIERDLSHPDPLVAAAALAAAREAGAAAAEAALAALLRVDRTPALVRAAEEALLGAPPSAAALLPFVVSTDREARLCAARVLAGCGSEGAAQFWESCGGKEDPAALSSFASAARREGQVRGGEALVAALRTALTAPRPERARLRIAVVAGAAGLGSLSPDLAAAALRSLADPADPFGDLAALACGNACGRAAAQREAGAAEARDRLLAAGRDGPGPVRLRVAEALGRYLRASAAPGWREEEIGFLEGAFEKWPPGPPGPAELADALRRGMGEEPEPLRGKDPFHGLLDSRG